MCKPVCGGLKVTQEFGAYSTKYGVHTGIDIVPSSDFRVFAPSNGVVAAVGYGTQEGNYIVIQHKPGDFDVFRCCCPSEVWTKYYHLASYTVQPGQRVLKGQFIGVIGNTGLSSTGRHLHFETRFNGRYGTPVNPREFVRFGDGHDIW
jgi:murein DD-endopeptidase MepM/ murein hydrolase activator NlpD